jgi:hypothetical protein
MSRKRLERILLHSLAISISRTGVDNIRPYRRTGIPAAVNRQLVHVAEPFCSQAMILAELTVGNGTISRRNNNGKRANLAALNP